ncbi:6381_t:CDS:1, partial [Rhizophagus irregularis]
ARSLGSASVIGEGGRNIGFVEKRARQLVQSEFKPAGSIS